MSKKKLLLIKICINGLGYATFLAMFSYMIPIVMTFELNVYDMSMLARLFSIAMTSLFLFFASMNKILKKYNEMELTSGHRNLIREMIDIRYSLGAGNNTLITILILFAIAVIITYALWWWNADIWPIEAAFYYIILIVYTTVNLFTIMKYIKNFTFFDKRLHNEVYK